MIRTRPTLKGIVVEGNRLGRTLGFPTANLPFETSIPECIQNGVYAVWVGFEGNWYKGMANIGTRPTLGMNKLVIEAHIFDFTGDLYGREITIVFSEKIRDEKKFAGLEELKLQLRSDRTNALVLLSGRKNPDSQTS